MIRDPRHPHVLVVDDDADTRELYRMMLGSVGYRVETAENVRTAIASARRSIPDVVVTDWRLPDGDGFAVADGLRERHELRHVPLVAVTGVSISPSMAAEARERGFTATLLKPVLPDDVLRTVRAAGEIGTARRLRLAARLFRRYAARVARHSRQNADLANALNRYVGELLSRTVARSGEDIALMLADDNAQYVAIGGSARELTGYEPQELVTLSVWDLTPLPDGVSGRNLWHSFIESGTQEGRYTLRRRDGEPVTAQYCAIANIVPGLHVSAIAETSQLPTSF